MAKINNRTGIDIIPIGSRAEEETIDDRQDKMERLPYISDPTLVPRVQKYLESNVDKTYVDINTMADELQRNYREYARLKRNPFRNSVKKAYSIVLQSYGLEDQDNSSSDEEVSDDSAPEGGPSFHSNTLNNQLANMYSRNAPKQLDESELIDISSDDSDATTPTYNEKSLNGPSTSQPLNNATIKKIIDHNKNDKSYERGRKRKSETANLPPYPSISKKKKPLLTPRVPVVTFKDFGGIDKTLENVVKLLKHLRHPEISRKLGIAPPRGFLLHGPPGCGKTLLANAIAGELGITLLQVSAPELVAGISGESEQRIRELFERAVASAPCVLFIDEIDAITQNRENAAKDMERRIVAQLLTCMDDLRQNENGDRVLVIGATNRPDTIDKALRRGGRFDREIRLGIPNLQARIQILKVLTARLTLQEGFDYEMIAKLTPGYVGVDLRELTTEAAMTAINRVLESHEERLKLTETLALQKAAEERKKLQELKSNEQNKSETEIIVDDDVVPKSAQTPSSESNLDNPIVVIDDDTKQSTTETPSVTSENTLNGQAPSSSSKEPQDELSEQEPMPVDLVKPTKLEEMLWALHNDIPLTDNELCSVCITMNDFIDGLKSVQPSLKREGFATVPDVTWDDIGSLKDVREVLQRCILAPVKNPDKAKKYGITTPAGVLLCGPPGCGKTLVAKAIANEAGINFISVNGPELLNMYLGESERAVRVCFERARNSAPCVIFFDELDSICPKRSESKEEGTSKRVVNQMLTEMDGIQGRKDVYILAASNRPDIIDPAILRPGRLDKILFVGLPTSNDRVDILRAITKNGTKFPLAPDVDIEMIGNSEECRGYTGADLAALVLEASTIAFSEDVLSGDPQRSAMIRTEHFKRAIARIRPSVPEKDLKLYEKLRKMYSAVPEQDIEEMEYS